MTASGLHLMAKPAGPLCNLDCSYCFYLEKEQLYPARQRFLMSDEVLRAFVAQNIANEVGPEVLFTWQGGEPMLRGLDFYRRAVALQQELGGGKTIRNALQTNGTLLDDDWCRFLASAGFMVGISLDGPSALHDAERVDKQGRGTHAAVMRGLGLLKRYGIAFNVLVTVTQQVAQQPLQVYRFLTQQGVRHIQFNPVVERLPERSEHAVSLTFAQPGKVSHSQPRLAMAPHSVGPEDYGNFLIAVFDAWVRHDVGRVYVMNFEWALAAFLRLPSPVCLFAEQCGRALIVEHNGDVFSCDHFMYPEHLLGNLQQADIAELAGSAQQRAFGEAKAATLPDYCQRCPYLFACHGECPKNRFARTPDGAPGLNYLCPSYQKYFRHITQYMQAMVKLISHGQPASLIMQAFKGPLAVRLDGPS
ncbi:MAG: anaerobic sulfatase maturase [Sphingomonadaceae bacterium]